MPILGFILKKLFSQGSTSDLVEIFFYTLLGHIKNSQRTEFKFRPLFEKYLALKLKVLKIPFGTATLKPYRTVNTHPKLTFNSSF